MCYSEHVTSILSRCHNHISFTTQIPWPFPDLCKIPQHFQVSRKVVTLIKHQMNGSTHETTRKILHNFYARCIQKQSQGLSKNSIGSSSEQNSMWKSSLGIILPVLQWLMLTYITSRPAIAGNPRCKNITAKSVHLTSLYHIALTSTNDHLGVLRHYVCT